MRLEDIVRIALEEDLGPLGDITAALIDNAQASGRFVARREGVVAGTACIVETFRQLDPTIKVSLDVDDGDKVLVNGCIARVDGPFATILTGERTALNFLCHLSGVATLTRRYVEKAGGVRILDTRKTTPGLRALEKAAVRAGGGVNHRGSLSEMVLVKDNHLTGLSIAEAVVRARALWPGRGVEVECDRIEQVREAVTAGADVVMLDNMTPLQVAEATREVAHAARIEVSGGVNLDTVAEYAAAGPDFISVGALTHSAPILDIGLDF